EGLFPAEPAIVVLKIDRPARLPPQAADQAAIEKYVQRNACPGPRHQNKSSILSVEAFVRGRTTSSMSRAVRMSKSVRSCVPGSPASTPEIDPGRRLVFPAISFCV